MNCSICGSAFAWCVDPDDKRTYWLCGECAAARVMESFFENQALLAVARAAKRIVDSDKWHGLMHIDDLEAALAAADRLMKATVEHLLD